jgi:hypothetical protein
MHRKARGLKRNPDSRKVRNKKAEKRSEKKNGETIGRNEDRVSVLAFVGTTRLGKKDRAMVPKQWARYGWEDVVGNNEAMLERN